MPCFTRIAVLPFCALALSAAAPAWTGSFPSEPPEPGQTLLEWADLPILKHDIPPDRRSDLSSCSEADEGRLEATARTCWPILRAYRLFLQMDFAAVEPSGDAEVNRRLALAYADDLIDLIGEPVWPLQTHILMRTFEVEARLLADEERWEDALAANARQVAAIDEAGGLDRDFRRAFALATRTDLLLAAGRRDEAREVLERSRPLLSRPDGARNGWAFSNQHEAIVIDAIRHGDLTFAETMLDRYLVYLHGAPKGLRFGLIDTLDLKLYLAAGRNDVAAALGLLDERTAALGDRKPCLYGDILFPYVLAPISEAPEIAARLRDMRCPPKVMKKLAQTSATGIVSYAGDPILPRHADRTAED